MAIGLDLPEDRLFGRRAQQEEVSVGVVVGEQRSRFGLASIGFQLLDFIIRQGNKLDVGQSSAFAPGRCGFVGLARPRTDLVDRKRLAR